MRSWSDDTLMERYQNVMNHYIEEELRTNSVLTKLLLGAFINSGVTQRQVDEVRNRLGEYPVGDNIGKGFRTLCGSA